MFFDIDITKNMRSVLAANRKNQGYYTFITYVNTTVVANVIVMFGMPHF